MIKLIGISLRNGKKFPIFKTEELIENSEEHRIKLTKKYKRECYLMTVPVDSEYELPLSFTGDKGKELKIVSIKEIENYLE